MDNKNKWKRYLSALKDDMMFTIKAPNSSKGVWWAMKYAETKYENPKNYKNYLAFNDGTWLRFPKEYRSKKGKPKAIYLAGAKSAIKELAFFCRFQWLLGVRLKEEFVYHMVCFLCDVVKLNEGAFDCNQKNQEVLFKIADNVLSTEVKQETLDRLKDERLYCIDPHRLAHMDDCSKKSMQAKARRMSTSFKIVKKYDADKSNRENAIECEVSISTIKRFKKNKSDVEMLYLKYMCNDDKIQTIL